MGIPAGAVSHSLKTRIDALSSASIPDVYLDEAPLVASAAVQPPYIVLTDRPSAVEYLSDLDRIETVDAKVTIYHTSKATLQDIALALMYDGEVAANRAGLDDADSLPALPTGYTLNKCERSDSGMAVQEIDRGQSAEPVFRGELNYRVELFYDAS